MFEKVEMAIILVLVVLIVLGSKRFQGSVKGLRLSVKNHRKG